MPSIRRRQASGAIAQLSTGVQRRERLEARTGQPAKEAHHTPKRSADVTTKGVDAVDRNRRHETPPDGVLAEREDGHREPRIAQRKKQTLLPLREQFHSTSLR